MLSLIMWLNFLLFSRFWTKSSFLPSCHFLSNLIGMCKCTVINFEEKFFLTTFHEKNLFSGKLSDSCISNYIAKSLNCDCCAGWEWPAPGESLQLSRRLQHHLQRERLIPGLHQGGRTGHQGQSCRPGHSGEALSPPSYIAPSLPPILPPSLLSPAYIGCLYAVPKLFFSYPLYLLYQIYFAFCLRFLFFGNLVSVLSVKLRMISFVLWLQVSFISVYLPQEVKAAEDLKLTVTRSSSKKMASKVRLSSIQCCGSGSGIRIRIIFPFFWVKILKFFHSDPGSGINILDPQHCLSLPLPVTSALPVLFFKASLFIISTVSGVLFDIKEPLNPFIVKIH